MALTRERLQSYIPLKLEVIDQLERITRMRSAEYIPPMRESIGSSYSPGGGDRLADAIIRRLEYQEKIAPSVYAQLDELDAIREEIDALPDPMYRLVLRLRYIDIVEGRQRGWKDIAAKIYGNNEGRHVKAVQRLHDKAIEDIE